MYIKEICIAGNTIEVMKKHSWRYGRSIPRGKNEKKTPEDVAKVNQRNAETKLRRLINTNFKENDLHMVLTYKKNERPSPDEAKILIAKFLRDIRKIFKKKGTVFKYILVTEYKKASIHHHIVMSYLDPREIQKVWPYGKARPTLLDGTGQYAELANYLIKETSKTFKTEKSASGKRWSSSRNLEKPIINKKIIGANSWRKEPVAQKGYYIEKDSIRIGFSEFDGYPYQFYSMIRLDNTDYG